MAPPIDEDFDFQDQDKPKKKKKQTKKNTDKSFDFEDQPKTQKKQTIKKTKPGSMDNQFLFDDYEDLQKQQQKKAKNKNSFEDKNYFSNQSKTQNLKLPAINTKQEKSLPLPTNKTYTKNKDLTSLQKLEIKKFQIEKKSPKNKQSQSEYAFHEEILSSDNEKIQTKKKSQIKKVPIQQPKPKQPKIQKKKQEKLIVVPIKQSPKITPKKQSSSQSQNDYQQELFEQVKEQKKQHQIIIKPQPQKTVEKEPIKSNTQNKPIQKQKKVQPPKSRQMSSKQSKRVDVKSVEKKRQEQTVTEAPITKYKDLITKNFPQQQQSKVSRMKSDAINRVNDKIRDMIKGFSNELTSLIDKNLILLQKNEKPQIQQQIQGDPIANQLQILRENFKNNQKALAITEKQLQSMSKKDEKMGHSTQHIIQLNEQIEAHKNHINQNKKVISNLKNQIQKQTKKVMTIPQGNNTSETGQTNGNFKNSLGMRVNLVNMKGQNVKHKEKLLQLNKKLQSLEEKLSSASQKKNAIIQKAQQHGLSLCSKQQKSKYEELKKKRDQLALFQSKHKSSIKSKQTVINHQITDLQILLNDYNIKYEDVAQNVQFSKARIFQQIRKAKQNQNIKLSIKQVLQKLQEYMNDDKNSTFSGEQNLNSLQYISDKIYKREYSNSNMKKNKQPQIPQKKVYKNYLKQISNTQQNIKEKNSTVQIPNQNKKKSQLSNRRQNQRYSNNDGARVNKVQSQQRQRKWTQLQQKQQDRTSNQVSMNPFKSKKNNPNFTGQSKSLALKSQQKDVMKNKQIIKLIQKNKQKIHIDQQPNPIKSQRQAQQSKNSASKKSFQFKIGAKTRIQHNTQPNQKQQIQYRKDNQITINAKQDLISKQNQSKAAINLNVRLADKNKNSTKIQQKIQEQIPKETNTNLLSVNNNNTQNQPSSNATSNNPFKLLKLKKQTNRSSTNMQSQYQNKYKIYEQPIKQQKLKQQNQLKLPWQIQNNNKTKQSNLNLNHNKLKTQPQKPVIIQQQQTSNKNQYGDGQTQQATIRPRRMIRKKPQESQQSGYQISSLQNRNQSPTKQQAPVIIQKKDQPYDPFKKFIQNKDASLQSNQTANNNNNNHSNHNIGKLNLDVNKNLVLSSHDHSNEQPIGQVKPKMILFKKNKEQPKNNELNNNNNMNININMNNANKNNIPVQKQKQQPKQDEQQKYVRKERQGRVKKQKQSLTSQNPNKINIYDNAEDLTVNLIDQNANNKQSSNNNGRQSNLNLNKYEVAANNKDIKQMNLNDILGIPQKSKHTNVDAELLLDVNAINKRGSKMANKKKNDFFDDLQI